MSRLFITGDIHGDPTKFNTENFPIGSELTKNDYVIVCGDFGLIWDYTGENKREKYWLDWLNNKPWTTLFIDGNHENFDRLYDYPIELWNNGKVHKIRDSVIHLMRGQVFIIDNTKIFTFGGAKSHDIQGGILEVTDPNYNQKKKELNRNYIPYRINHISWWEQELPTVKEMNEGLNNLQKVDNQVDLILTHCCATSTQNLMSHGFYKNDYETDYLEQIRQTVTFDKWFFGHYHIDQHINIQEICLYDSIYEFEKQRDYSNIFTNTER